MSWPEFPNGHRLTPHQEEGAEFLVSLADSRGFAILGDKPRLGKSYQAMAAANFMLQFGGEALIICPPGVRSVWRRAVADLRIGDWKATVLGDNEIFPFPAWLRKKRFSILIVDEGHRFSNQDSQRTNSLLGDTCDRKGGVAELADSVWWLTGTPMTAYPDKLWPMYRAFLAKENVNSITGRPYSFGDWKAKFTAQITFGVGRRKTVGSKNVGLLKKMLAPYYLGRGYEVFGKMQEPPDPTPYYVDLDANALEALQELEFTPEGRAIRKALNEGTLTRLGQDETSAQLRQAFALAKIPAVVELLSAEMDDDADMKVVVFAWHRNVLQALHKAFSKYGSVLLFGGVSGADRDGKIKKFQTDPKSRVCVAQIASMGEGVDLSAADDIMFVEQSWAPYQNEQASKRIFNLTKDRPLRVRAAIVDKTIDRDVSRALEPKTRAARQLFG